jgi:hypothetical protein
VALKAKIDYSTTLLLLLVHGLRQYGTYSEELLWRRKMSYDILCEKY